jgi:hypothetical protein
MTQPGVRYYLYTSRVPASGSNDVELTISAEKVCFVIFKAKHFGAEDAVSEDDPGSISPDDKDVSVLEDHRDDPVLEDLTSFARSLSEDERIDLVALAWLGRDDYSIDQWKRVREDAANSHNNRTAE